MKSLVKFFSFLLADKGFKVAGAAGVQDYEAEGGTLSKIVPPAPKS